MTEAQIRKTLVAAAGGVPGMNTATRAIDLEIARLSDKAPEPGWGGDA